MRAFQTNEKVENNYILVKIENMHFNEVLKVLENTTMSNISSKYLC